MPRQAHGRSPLIPGKIRPSKRPSTSGRNLNALAIAQEENPSKIRVRQSRLGVVDENDPGKARYRPTDHAAPSHPAKRRRIYEQADSANEGSEGDESEGDKWHIGVDDDDEDSEIDSDEAMAASDEERFEGFAFQGSKSKSSMRSLASNRVGDKNTAKAAHLKESSHEETRLDDEEQSADEDELGSHAVDLATVLDLDEESEPEHKKLQDKDSQSLRVCSPPLSNVYSSNESSEEDESWSGDAQSVLSVSEDETSVANHARLKSFVQGLEGNPSSTSKPAARPVTAGEPSDYGLTSSQKLTVADLLPTLKDPRLRESLKMLHNSEQKGPKTLTRSIPGKLEPPLPKRQQDRLDRQAAYEKSKETLGRWIDTVKQNRRAEHLSFPLTDPNSLAALGTSQLMPISQSEAVTPLESAIQSIMQESGLASKNNASTDQGEQAFEELQERKMSVEEVQARRAELRKERDLLFREEIRARRIKKIKSKAYRRVHRKERDRYAQEERAAMVAAGALDSEDERERQDRRRAEERMGARHKESRWAKQVKASNRTAWDEDARQGVTDLARKDEELRQRIEGKEPKESDESDFDTSDDDSSDAISIDKYDELEHQKLEQKLGALEAEDQDHSVNSRLNSMPFMKKAEVARKTANKAQIEESRQILAGVDDGAGEDENLVETGGRHKFGVFLLDQPVTATQPEEKDVVEEPLSAQKPEPIGFTQEQTLKTTPDAIPSAGAGIKRSRSKGLSNGANEKKAADTPENPWLSRAKERKSGLLAVEPIISTKAVLQYNTPQTNVKNSRFPRKSMDVPQATLEDWTSPSDSEDESPKEQTPGNAASHRNKDLVRMAFAGDDVFEAFAEEKKDIVDEEGDQIVENSLPGWGTWVGAGLSKKEQGRVNSRKTTTIIKGVEPNKRRDAKLDRVIINEKRSKKNARYLAPELPHPFESRQQYERSLQLPLGPEWTTKTAYQDVTKPRILLKPGVIRPMEKPIA